MQSCFTKAFFFGAIELEPHFTCSKFPFLGVPASSSSLGAADPSSHRCDLQSKLDGARLNSYPPSCAQNFLSLVRLLPLPVLVLPILIFPPPECFISSQTSSCFLWRSLNGAAALFFFFESSRCRMMRLCLLFSLNLHAAEWSAILFSLSFHVAPFFFFTQWSGRSLLLEW